MNWRRQINLVFLTTITLLFIGNLNVFGQSGEIKGTVVNGIDQTYIPFAQIHFNQKNDGAIGNIDGTFSVPDTIISLYFKAVGYKSTIVTNLNHRKKELKIELFPEEKEKVDLNEISAKKLMQIVLQNSSINNIHKQKSYQYTAYHKLWLTAEDKDSEERKGEKEKIEHGTDMGHLFLMETLFRKRFLQPNYENEEIISSKVSGLKEEPYILMAKQLKNFMVYDDNFLFFDSEYPSPVGSDALKNYNFSIDDTLINNKLDTVFTLQFYPEKENLPNGLKGALNISSQNYAVQSFWAEPANIVQGETWTSFKQEYDYLPSGEWFPGELDATIHFTKKKMIAKDSISPTRKTYDLPIVAHSQTFVYQRELNIPLDPSSFSKYSTTVPAQESDSIQNFGNYRYQPLTAKDSMTYLMLDSLAKASEVNKRIKLMNKLAQGKIPVGFIDFDLNYLYGYNLYEGSKFGLGMETNRKLWSDFSVGGYVIYGTRDKAIRHGEWLNIFPKGEHDLKISLGYRDMKMEFGESEFLEKSSLFNPEYYRTLLVNNMYRAKRYFLSTDFRPIETVELSGFADFSDNSAQSQKDIEYSFRYQRITRMGVKMRFSPGIKYMKDADMLIETTPPRSDWFLNIIQGISLFDGEYVYTKMEFKGKIYVPLSTFGKAIVMLRGGKIFNDAPETEWFNGYGSYPGSITLAAPFSFATMRMNEFSAQQFTAMHVRYDFSPTIIPPTSKFRPELILAQNIGFGTLNDTTNDRSNDFSKGYYETGFEANKLLKLPNLSLGVGIYYRYGPYHLPVGSKNFAYKFGLLFSL